MGKSTQMRSVSWTLALGMLAVLTDCSSGDNGDQNNTSSLGMSGAGGFTAGVSGGATGIGGGAAGTQFGQGGFVSGQGGFVSGQGGLISGQGGVVSGQGGVISGQGGMVSGQGGDTVAAGGDAMGAGGEGVGGEGTAGSAGAAGAAGAPPQGNGCTPAPSGTFQTTTVPSTGPDGNYTIFRPTTLGEGGFLHPPLAWGNGLGTQPPLYAAQLSEIAANGFVIIANPGPGSDPQVVAQGLQWLLDQNNSGEYAGKLAVDCAGTIGYSMGGGAAVGSGSNPAVKAIVSIHGLQDAAEAASGPILLITSEGDTFVTKSGFVEPCYNRSSVQPTILASHTGGDHLDPLADCPGWEAGLAWLRYWIYGDQSQRDWFFGDSCTLCSWPDFRRKNLPEWN